MAATALACAMAAVAAAQPATAPLPLAEALALAMAADPQVAATTERLAASREARRFAGRLLNPAIELRSENFASGTAAGVPLDLFATVTQPFELGGKRGARLGVADAAIGRADAAGALARQDAALAVVNDYLAAVRQRDRAQVQSTQADVLREAVRVVGRRVEVGTAAAADLLTLQTAAARATLDHTRSRYGAAMAAATLGARLARDVGVEALVRPAVPPVPDDDAPAVQRRPDVRVALAAQDAAARVAAVERARGLPDVAITAGVKRTAGYATGVAALTMPVPLFDRNRLARTVATGELRAAEFEVAAATRRARGEVTAARIAARTLSDGASSATALVADARAARDAAQSAFAAGALDVWRLIEAERVHAEAQLLALDLAIDATAAAIEARVAAGETPLR